MAENQTLDYKRLIEKVTENGDLVILGQKGTCKSTLLMNLGRKLRSNSNNHVVIFETFPKFVHEFDKIPYMRIADNQVQKTKNVPYLEEDKSIIQWSKDYSILNAKSVIEFLRNNKDCLFLIECQEMEKISAFMSFVIFAVYKKNYQLALDNELSNEHFWFLCEESHNLLDSTTVQKKTFSQLRKEQNEFRNLNMHLVCVAIRLQDLAPKIRAKMSIIVSRVSLDDYQLKVRNLLRNSKYRDMITTLPKGQFVFPELDLILHVQPFHQQGKPFEFNKPTVEVRKEAPRMPKTVKPTKAQQPNSGLSVIKQLIFGFIILFSAILVLGWGWSGAVIAFSIDGILYAFYEMCKKNSLPAQNHSHYVITKAPTVEEIDDESEYDGILGIDEKDALFPPDEFDL